MKINHSTEFLKRLNRDLLCKLLYLQIIVVVDLLDPADLAEGGAHRLRPLAVPALQDLHPLHVGADLHQVPHRKLK